MEMSKMASSIDWLFEYFVGLQGFSFLTHDMRFFQLYTTFSVKKIPTSKLFILFGHLNAAHYFPLELGVPFSL